MADNQNTLTAGQRESVLLQDVHLIEMFAHFNRERIASCTRHIKGAGTYGYFQVFESMAPYANVKFLENPEKKTLFMQQTAVLGSPCSDTVTMAAVEATVNKAGKGIFKDPQWIKSSNDRKERYD